MARPREKNVTTIARRIARLEQAASSRTQRPEALEGDDYIHSRV